MNKDFRQNPIIHSGVIILKETTTPATKTDYIQIYGKSDDKAYIKDGAGIEHEIAYNTTSLNWNVTTVNAATYDLLSTDYILNVTYTSTAAVTSLTLPTAQVVEGRVIVVKDAGGNAGTNNITIDTEGSETIDGSATAVINANYSSINIYCDGSNWLIF